MQQNDHPKFVSKLVSCGINGPNPRNSGQYDAVQVWEGWASRFFLYIFNVWSVCRDLFCIDYPLGPHFVGGFTESYLDVVRTLSYCRREKTILYPFLYLL